MRKPSTPTEGRSPFLPLLLIAASLIMVLSWNLAMAWKQKTHVDRTAIQQEIQLDQAVQAEAKLRAIMTDLLELAKTDADASAIVKRYKIAINESAGK